MDCTIYEKIANALIDDRIEMYGIKNTVQYLYEFCGLDKDELKAIGFEDESIEYALDAYEDEEGDTDNE